MFSYWLLDWNTLNNDEKFVEAFKLTTYLESRYITCHFDAQWFDIETQPDKTTRNFYMHIWRNSSRILQNVARFHLNVTYKQSRNQTYVNACKKFRSKEFQEYILNHHDKTNALLFAFGFDLELFASDKSFDQIIVQVEKNNIYKSIMGIDKLLFELHKNDKRRIDDMLGPIVMYLCESKDDYKLLTDNTMAIELCFYGSFISYRLHKFIEENKLGIDDSYITEEMKELIIRSFADNGLTFNEKLRPYLLEFAKSKAPRAFIAKVENEFKDKINRNEIRLPNKDTVSALVSSMNHGEPLDLNGFEVSQLKKIAFEGFNIVNYIKNPSGATNCSLMEIVQALIVLKFQSQNANKELPTLCGEQTFGSIFKIKDNEYPALQNALCALLVENADIYCFVGLEILLAQKPDLLKDSNEELIITFAKRTYALLKSFDPKDKNSITAIETFSDFISNRKSLTDLVNESLNVIKRQGKTSPASINFQEQLLITNNSIGRNKGLIKDKNITNQIKAFIKFTCKQNSIKVKAAFAKLLIINTEYCLNTWSLFKIIMDNKNFQEPFADAINNSQLTIDKLSYLAHVYDYFSKQNDTLIPKIILNDISSSDTMTILNSFLQIDKEIQNFIRNKSASISSLSSLQCCLTLYKNFRSLFYNEHTLPLLIDNLQNQNIYSFASECNKILNLCKSNKPLGEIINKFISNNSLPIDELTHLCHIINRLFANNTFEKTPIELLNDFLSLYCSSAEFRSFINVISDKYLGNAYKNLHLIYKVHKDKFRHCTNLIETSQIDPSVFATIFSTFNIDGLYELYKDALCKLSEEKRELFYFYSFEYYLSHAITKIPQSKLPSLEDLFYLSPILSHPELKEGGSLDFVLSLEDSEDSGFSIVSNCDYIQILIEIIHDKAGKIFFDTNQLLNFFKPENNPNRLSDFYAVCLGTKDVAKQFFISSLSAAITYLKHLLINDKDMPLSQFFLPNFKDMLAPKYKYLVFDPLPSQNGTISGEKIDYLANRANFFAELLATENKKVIPELFDKLLEGNPKYIFQFLTNYFLSGGRLDNLPEQLIFQIRDQIIKSSPITSMRMIQHFAQRAAIVCQPIDPKLFDLMPPKFKKIFISQCISNGMDPNKFPKEIQQLKITQDAIAQCQKQKSIPYSQTK